MSPDELDALRESFDPEWHQLRERRVLEAALEARRRARARTGSRARTRTIALGVLAAAATAIAAIVAWPEAPPSLPEDARPANPAAEDAPAAPPHMRFADGSTATLSPGASVEIEEQSATAVRVLQRSGTVRYRVVRNPARLFAIDAGGVRVTVIGTEFDVEHVDGRVRIAVLRGRVRVSDGARELELSRGETLQIAPSPPETTVPEPAPVVALVEPAPARPSAAELERRADAARIAGRHDDAAALLERLIRLAPRDPRATTALFTLGSIRAAQGRHAAAARYFARYRARAPHGTLHEDALAGEAVQAAAAGDAARGERLAREYAERYPNGAHRAAMRRLTGP